MLISPAYAQAAGGEPSFLVSLLPLILIFIVFWFLLIRPQQKRMREHREMVQATKKGDKVITSGGIYGTVARVVDDNSLEVEIAPNVKVKLARPTISENLTRAEQSQTPSAANDQGKGGQKKGLLDRLTGR
jgi:preprotein translocase subunit YajC